MWQVAGWILELDRGQGIPFEGNYSSWLDSKVCLHRIGLSCDQCSIINQLSRVLGPNSNATCSSHREIMKRETRPQRSFDPQFLSFGRGLEGCLSPKSMGSDMKNIWALWMGWAHSLTLGSWSFKECFSTGGKCCSYGVPCFRVTFLCFLW